MLNEAYVDVFVLLHLTEICFKLKFLQIACILKFYVTNDL